LLLAALVRRGGGRGAITRPGRLRTGCNDIREQPRAAALRLAASGAPLGERIGAVYARGVYLLEEVEPPADLLADFAGLSGAMSRRVPVGTDGTIAASARTLSEREAHEFAESIVSMSDRVAEYGPHG
jgi:hypothetical protein